MISSIDGTRTGLQVVPTRVYDIQTSDTTLDLPDRPERARIYGNKLASISKPSSVRCFIRHQSLIYVIFGSWLQAKGEA